MLDVKSCETFEPFTQNCELSVLFTIAWIKHDNSLFCSRKFDQSHSKIPCYQVKEQAPSKYCQDI